MIHTVGDIRIAEISSAKIETAQDALDLIAEYSFSQGITALAVHKHCFMDDFFDLKTGLLGEAFQKFANYRCRLAIIGDFSIYKSKSLNDFIYECNSGRDIFFVDNIEIAKEKLSS